MAESKPQGKPSTTKKDKAIYKVFNDSVHGHIEMHALLVKIIDTPEFQRLRNIKQFGGGYYVYPGASHNRFEHCLGVAHLAGKLVQNLSDRQPTLDIDDKDELCVQIAGLCHDLGHGPFSHAFDDFMDQVMEDNKWKHEDQSVKMFYHLIEGHIKDIMENKYNFTKEDFTFITELINPETKDNKNEWPFKGRDKKKSFLYEIVANKVTGIDVDKMDYFSRDCHHLGMTSNFSHERYMMFARVCTDENGEKHICMRDKEAVNMYELFHVRHLIRQRACHHRVAKAVELMITDALIEANSHFKLGEKNLTICEAVEDLDTFTHLTDDILQEIERSTSKDLKQSRDIIKRIRDRDLYRYVDGELFKRNEVTSLKTAKERKDLLETWIKKIRNLSRKEDLPNQQTNPSPEEQLKKFLDKKNNQQAKLSPEDFRIVFIDLTYGMEESNPIDSLLFYKKNQPDKSYKQDKAKVSHMLPETFAETRVMLFYKGLPKKHVKTLWEKLRQDSDKTTGDVPAESTGDVPAESTGDVPAESTGEPSGKIYIKLSGDTITSQEIINMCENYNYQFFDDRTFISTDLKHLTTPDMWKRKLSAWLEEVKENPDGKNPDLELNDFLMVSYCFQDEPNTKLTKVMLFYKGLSKIDVKEFWDLVKATH